MRILGPDRLMFVKNEDLDGRPEEVRGRRSETAQRRGFHAAASVCQMLPD